MDQAPSQLLTTAEVAQYLRKSVYWVQTNHKALGMPSYLIGREYCFPPAEFFAWVEKQRVNGDSAKKLAQKGQQRVSLLKKAG